MLISGLVAPFLLAMIVVLDAGPAHSQDLDAGKSGQGLFATNCSSCHRTPRGLAKRTNRISLFYFLREHYTASQASANELTTYLMATGGEPLRAKRKSTAPQPTADRSTAPSANAHIHARAGNRSTPAGERSDGPPRPATDVPSR